MDALNSIRRNEDIVHSYLDCDVVMMNIESGKYYRFNEVGTRIWELLGDEATSIDSLTDQLTTEFDVPRGTLSADIQTFVTKGQEQGLITVS